MNFKGELSVIIMQYYYFFLFSHQFSFPFFSLCVHTIFWLNYSVSFFLHYSRTSLKQKRRSLIMCPVELYVCVRKHYLSLLLFVLSGVISVFVLDLLLCVYTKVGEVLFLLFVFLNANHLWFYINRVPACSCWWDLICLYHYLFVCYWKKLRMIIWICVCISRKKRDRSLRFC